MRRSLIAAALAALLPVTAGAQLMLTGAGAGGAAGAYTAQGVHFDWQSQLYTGSALTNGGGALGTTQKLTVSFWVRSTPALAGSAGIYTPSTYTTGYIADFVSAIETGSQNSETVPGQNTVFDAAGGNFKTLRVNTSDATGGAVANQCLYAFTDLLNVQSSDWTHILYSFDGSASGTTSKKLSVYVNGVKRGSGGCTYGSTSPMNVGINNVNGWGVLPNIDSLHTGQATMEFADVFVDFTNAVVDSSNNISAATVAKFYNAGLPVDLGPTCSLPLGSQPDLCFTGGPTGFATNKGTVTNSFTVKGQNITNGKSGLFAATYNPGALPTGQVYEKGTFSELVSTTGQTTLAMRSSGISIKQNDLIIVALEIYDASVINHGLTCPTNYTVLFGPFVGTTNQAQNLLICYKLAAADGESDAVTWPTWTTGNGNAMRYAIMVFGGVNTSTPIGATASSAIGSSSDTTAWSAPTITTTQSGATLLSIFAGKKNMYLAPMPNEAGIRVLTAGSASQIFAHIIANTEALGAAGATGARSFTNGGSGDGWAMSVELQHN